MVGEAVPSLYFRYGHSDARFPGAERIGGADVCFPGGERTGGVDVHSPAAERIGCAGVQPRRNLLRSRGDYSAYRA